LEVKGVILAPFRSSLGYPGNREGQRFPESSGESLAFFVISTKVKSIGAKGGLDINSGECG